MQPDSPSIGVCRGMLGRRGLRIAERARHSSQERDRRLWFRARAGTSRRRQRRSSVCGGLCGHPRCADRGLVPTRRRTDPRRQLNRRRSGDLGGLSSPRPHSRSCADEAGRARRRRRLRPQFLLLSFQGVRCRRAGRVVVSDRFWSLLPLRASAPGGGISARGSSRRVRRQRRSWQSRAPTSAKCFTD
jgi:hypothetical protein